jgi:hypothetical protein
MLCRWKARLLLLSIFLDLSCGARSIYHRGRFVDLRGGYLNHGFLECFQQELQELAHEWQEENEASLKQLKQLLQGEHEDDDMEVDDDGKQGDEGATKEDVTFKQEFREANIISAASELAEEEDEDEPLAHQRTREPPSSYQSPLEHRPAAHDDQESEPPLTSRETESSLKPASKLIESPSLSEPQLGSETPPPPEKKQKQKKGVKPKKKAKSKPKTKKKAKSKPKTKKKKASSSSTKDQLAQALHATEPTSRPAPWRRKLLASLSLVLLCVLVTLSLRLVEQSLGVPE